MHGLPHENCLLVVALLGQTALVAETVALPMLQAAIQMADVGRSRLWTLDALGGATQSVNASISTSRMLSLACKYTNA